MKHGFNTVVMVHVCNEQIRSVRVFLYMKGIERRMNARLKAEKLFEAKLRSYVD